MRRLFPMLFLASCLTPRSEEEIIQEAKDKVFPAVVFIKPIREEFRGGKREKVQTFGSGVIINEDGYVVTNNHVAEKATEIRCALSDREEVGADVVGLDPETDLAVLKIRLSERKVSSPLPFAAFGNSTLVKEGELVMAMGAPHGFERSVSRGIISSAERYFDFAPYNLWFQTDAAINPGNSGGPLVNIRGEIVGINARGLRGAENLSFAIPAAIVQDIVKKLIHDKHLKQRQGILEPGRVERAWTGIRLQALQDFTKSAYLPATQGVLIAGVEDASPADRAGLRAGDIIHHVNDVPLDGIYETDLPKVEGVLANLTIAVPSHFLVQRGAETLSIPVVPESKAKQEGGDFECKKWDLTVKEITKSPDPTMVFLGFQRPRGVYVQGVKPNGNARLSGLLPYDIVTHIGDVEIDSLAAMRTAYDQHVDFEKGKRKVLIKVIRAGYPRYIALEFERDAERIEEEQ